MARSFSYDHFRDNKRDDRSALRKAEYKAFTQHRPEAERDGGPLHGRGAQARTRELWRELHEGERQQRATVEAQASRVPIGALPPHDELPDEILESASAEPQTDEDAAFERAFAPLEGDRERGPRKRGSPGALQEARSQFGTLQRSLGEAAGAFARLLRIPVEALRMRNPQPE
ncbi:MAG TPA: hypothetical protein VK013_11660 [Myxococcaceae bacterium]|nr:hypothetical protein [Myxococcaceae bacterium]